MDFPSHLFPGAMLWPANGLLLLVLVAAVWQAPLSRLAKNEYAHVYFASCVVLLLLWNTTVGVLPALNFHLLGVTTVTLMFGWGYALIAVLLVTVATLLNQQEHFVSIGLNVLISGGIPILLTESLLRFARRKLPHHFFVYVYVNGFLAAGLSTLAAACAGALLVFIADAHSAEWLSYQYFPYFPLIFFSEALMNGMILTMLVALRPGWVCSFEDRLYLHGK